MRPWTTFVWNRWDSRLFLRAVAVALAALVLAWLVTAVTDEGGVSWGERAGRALPLTPGCAAIGAWAALAPALARGEARALEALGRCPAQIGAGAVLGGAAAGIAAAVAIAALHVVDIRGYYPTAARASAWRWESDAFVDPLRGVRVDGAGVPEKQPAQASAALAVLPLHAREAAALATAAAGAALPMLLAQAMLTRHRSPRQSRRDADGTSAGSPWRGPHLVDSVATFAALAVSLVLFQASAARRAPALLGALPPVVLLAHAARRYRGLS